MVAWPLQIKFARQRNCGKIPTRMTHRYRIEPDLGLLIAKFEGTIGRDDVWNGILKSAHDPVFQPGMNVILDMTTAELDFGTEEAHRLVFEISTVPTLKYSQIAVVAPGAAQFGIARMIGALAQKYDFFDDYRVFSDFSQARAWLELPDEVELVL